MSYERFYPNGWQSGETGGTPITPEALNHMEKGIEQAYLNFEPAVESAEYPGCYYRTVNGAVEWINPPMVPGVEYRTTERWNSKIVYTMLVDCGEMISGGSLTYKESGTTIRYAGFAGGVPLPFLASDGFGGDWSLWMRVNNNTIGVYGGTGYADTTISTKAHVWYVKE